MSRHSLDTIPKVQDGGLWFSRVVIFNDFKDPLLKFKLVLHQMTTIFETLGLWAFIKGKIFLDLSFPLKKIRIKKHHDCGHYIKKQLQY